MLALCYYGLLKHSIPVERYQPGSRGGLREDLQPLHSQIRRSTIHETPAAWKFSQNTWVYWKQLQESSLEEVKSPSSILKIQLQSINHLICFLSKIYSNYSKFPKRLRMPALYPPLQVMVVLLRGAKPRGQLPDLPEWWVAHLLGDQLASGQIKNDYWQLID